MRSDLEGNLGPEGDLHDGRGPGGRWVGGSSGESRGKRVCRLGGSGIWRVDSDSRKLGDRME